MGRTLGIVLTVAIGCASSRGEQVATSGEPPPVPPVAADECAARLEVFAPAAGAVDREIEPARVEERFAAAEPFEDHIACADDEPDEQCAERAAANIRTRRPRAERVEARVASESDGYVGEIRVRGERRVLEAATEDELTEAILAIAEREGDVVPLRAEPKLVPGTRRAIVSGEVGHGARLRRRSREAVYRWRESGDALAAFARAQEAALAAELSLLEVRREPEGGLFVRARCVDELPL